MKCNDSGRKGARLVPKDIFRGFGWPVTTGAAKKVKKYQNQLFSLPGSIWVGNTNVNGA